MRDLEAPGEEPFEVRARTVVAATGVWSDDMSQMLTDVGVRPGLRVRASKGVHLVVPLHYPLQGDDGLLRQVFDCQRQAARDLGIDESLADLPHYRAYATLFDVLHLERAIRYHQEALKIGEKYAKFRIYAVEGLAP